MGVAKESTIIAAPLDLNVVTTVHAHLVVAAAERFGSDKRVASECGCSRSKGVVTAHAAEVGNLCDRSIQEDARSIDNTHTIDVSIGIRSGLSIVVNLIDAVLLGLVQVVDATLTSEVDVTIV